MREKNEKRVKSKAKRNTAGDGYYSCSILRPRARDARAKDTAKAKKVKNSIVRWYERLTAEGIEDPVPKAVDYAIALTNGTNDDRGIWLKMCNRSLNTFLGVLMEFEFDLNRGRSQLKNRSAAFQARLNRVLPREENQGGVK